MGVADNGRIWIRVNVEGPLKVNASELEFTCRHTCKLIPLSCRIYRVFGLKEVCSTQCDPQLMKGKLLTYEQCHN